MKDNKDRIVYTGNGNIYTPQRIQKNHITWGEVLSFVIIIAMIVSAILEFGVN